MKDSKIKGVIEEKISLKLNEIIQEYKIGKGRSIAKAIDGSAKKIAKKIAKKLKKGSKDIISDKKDVAPIPVKAKVKTNSTSKSSVQAKPELKKANTVPSSKPSSRRKNIPATIKNSTPSKSRTGLPKKPAEKANLPK